MATTAMDYESTNPDRFDDEGPRYDRDRSASPRREEEPSRRRSMSPNGTDRAPIKNDGPKGDRDDDGAINPGSNLFVTGIHPRLEEAEVTRLFEKYGDVEKCQIMKDPHTGESRGFGFVKMVTPEMADAAREGLQGEVIEGRTLSIEKARRARPRTPTPGKYFGPPKRDGPGGAPGGERRGFGGDRRRGGYGGGGFRDDSYRGSRGGGYREDRGGDRSYDRGYDRGYREERGYDRGYRGEDRGYDRRDRAGDDSYPRVDRYRDDRSERYAGGGGRGGAPDDRRGPSYDRGDRYERPSDREARPPRESAPSAGYGDSAPRTDSREPYGPR